VSKQSEASKQRRFCVFVLLPSFFSPSFFLSFFSPGFCFQKVRERHIIRFKGVLFYYLSSSIIIIIIIINHQPSIIIKSLVSCQSPQPLHLLHWRWFSMDAVLSVVLWGFASMAGSLID